MGYIPGGKEPKRKKITDKIRDQKSKGQKTIRQALNQTRWIKRLCEKLGKALKG